MTDAGLVRAESGATVTVVDARTGEKTVAEADEDGIVRNDEGHAYSLGAYHVYDGDDPVRKNPGDSDG